MNSIFNGELRTPKGRMLAWVDSYVLDHAMLRVAWTNFAPVLEGKLYRSNHPTPGRLRAYQRHHALKSLINLRGLAGNGSDALLRETARELGLDVVDAPLKSRGAPDRARVQRLLQAFASMRAPALVFCKSGADRAGFAAALFLLTQGVPASVACRHLALRFGYFAASDTGILLAFVKAYAREAEGRIEFADWLRDEYDPHALERSFQRGHVGHLVADRLLQRE